MSSISFDNGKRLIENGTKAYGHAEAEEEHHFTIDKIMETVSSQQSLTWSDGLAWAFPFPDENGTLSLKIHTERNDIRDYYAEMQLSGLKVVDGAPRVIDLRTDWYVFCEAQDSHVRSSVTGEELYIDVAVFFVMDGDGIASEIAWGKTEDVQLRPAERYELSRRYVAALRRQDFDGVLDMMSEDIQGAIRPYRSSDDANFIHLDGWSDMRRYYEAFFDHVSVIDVSVVNSIARDWYLFHDLLWTLDVESPSSGPSWMHVRTAEILPMRADGRFVGRVGYGTALEPSS